ncbi:MoaD/ThiS family protein [Candidatus Bathyarchaeota archaeon]|nr:MoaD/ThiS family protein [Candidatus Bathyarchaeota archaeon]
MLVRVRTFGELLEALGSDFMVKLEDGASVELLLKALAEKAGSKRDFILAYRDEEPNMAILVNGFNIQVLEKTATRLKDGDTVSLIPPVAGG